MEIHEIHINFLIISDDSREFHKFIWWISASIDKIRKIHDTFFSHQKEFYSFATKLKIVHFVLKLCMIFVFSLTWQIKIERSMKVT